MSVSAGDASIEGTFHGSRSDAIGGFSWDRLVVKVVDAFLFVARGRVDEVCVVDELAMY